MIIVLGISCLLEISFITKSVTESLGCRVIISIINNMRDIQIII